MDQFIPVGIQSRIGFMLLYGATGLPRGSPIVEVSNQRSPDCGGKCVSLRLVRMDQFIYCTIWDWFYATLRCYKVIIKIIWRESDKKRRVPKTSSYNLFFFFLTSHQICDQKVTNNKKKNTKAYAFLFIIWNKRQRDPRSRKVRRQF